MKLYSSPISPNSKRISVVAAELGLQLDAHQLDFAKGETRTEAYFAKNPMGKVPTVEDGKFVLWESPAILVYLATKYGKGKLLPRDPEGLADATRWMFWNASHLEAAVFKVAFEVWAKPNFPKLPPDPERIAEGKKDFDRYAPLLEARLRKGGWVLDAFSIADIAIGTSVEMAPNVGLELRAYPSIARWFAALTSRPSWKT